MDLENSNPVGAADNENTTVNDKSVKEHKPEIAEEINNEDETNKDSSTNELAEGTPTTQVSDALQEETINDKSPIIKNNDTEKTLAVSNTEPLVTPASVDIPTIVIDLSTNAPYEENENKNSVNEINVDSQPQTELENFIEKPVELSVTPLTKDTPAVIMTKSITIEPINISTNGVSNKQEEKSTFPDDQKSGKKERERPKWDNQIEFLMSCIATSVGLGNVWRFPFVAYENGGGAFLIAYIIVLLVIGKPMYYLETVLGQFSNSNCIKVWSLSPAMKGTGYAQALGASYVLSYYVSIIALCLYYLAMSFQATLPWSECQEGWEDCVPSVGEIPEITDLKNATSSAEHYFTKVVLQQSDGIHNGIGLPLWDLTLCLFVSWLIIFVIVARGVKSSGKAAYFLAIFPYFVLFILLIRAVTLPGAADGILFFVNPDWNKFLEIKVWYAAVTQVFFSLSVCSGALIMFSSYNEFKTNVYKYSMIVTTLDTFTSLLSGITIFGILGNLAYEMKYENISDVIGSGGASLAFVSYPDAIAKTPFVPQLFAVLFFMMMAVLGIGSGVAILSNVNTILLDAFPNVSILVMAAFSCSVGFLIGLVYCTPGGQYILELVDHYGGTFMRLFAAIAETIGVFWIYGVENICIDIEFMLGIKSSFYWRICWTIITPVVMITVFMYAMINTEALKFAKTYVYPNGAYIAGNCLQYVGIALIPIFIIASLWKYRSSSIVSTIRRAFGKKQSYGPSDPKTREEWDEFKTTAKYDRELRSKNWFHHALLSLYGGYRNFSKEK